MIHAYLGNCSCNNIRLTLRSHLEPSAFQPRSDAQTCQFCARYGGIWISDPQGELVLPANPNVEKKRFASEQIEFSFCAQCHELVYASFADSSSTKHYGVVRRDLFARIAAEAKPVRTTDFTNESIASAQARREKNWTPIRVENRNGR